MRVGREYGDQKPDGEEDKFMTVETHKAMLDDLKTAKEIGRAIPPNVLARADRVMG
jgi:hypothetical protein